MSEKESVLANLHALFETSGKNFLPHILIAYEVSEEGTPIGAVVKLKCSPLVGLGIIDVLQEKLNEARQTILDELDSQEVSTEEGSSAKQKIVNTGFDDIMSTFDSILSPEDKAYLEDCNRRAIEAIKSNNPGMLITVMKQMRDYIEKKKGNTPDSDFNLDDFKGGF